ncbi:hypothetical protein GOODEAATRI_008771 [Goodea atripinnis]|uniref:Uncharacterized protein n=1 Tax=Goodea atripinnis TaxID=208336 RepID=A0ABV0NSV4_9TELE
MASRTKDNFKGYNGIPVVEAPKKREAEPEPEILRPGKTIGVSRTGGTSKTVSKQLAGPPKPPPAMNFADLLRLAEKKQFEPVELKPKVKKEERLRTAEEIRELEMERKAKRPDKNRDSKVDGGREGSRSLSSSTSVRKNTTEKEQKHNRPQKNSIENTSLHRSGNKVQPTVTSDTGLSFSKPSVSDKERDRNKVPHSHRERSKMGMSTTSAATVSKNPSKALSSQVSAKQASSRPSFTQKPSTSSDLSLRKDKLSLHQKGASGIPRNRPSSVVGASQKSQQGSLQQTRPIQGSSLKQAPIAGGMKSSSGHLQRPGNNSVVGSNGKSLIRPSLGGPSKTGNQSQGRPVGIPQNKPGGAPQARLGGSGPGRGGSRPPGSGPFNPGSGGQVPGRPNGSLGSGPGRPKCTVVSETISSKNVGGPRPGVSVRPGMQQRPGMIPGMRPGMPPRPMMNRPPGGIRHHDQQNITVSVIGGGDLGMACVMSLLSKVILWSRVIVVTANSWNSEESYIKVVQTNVDLYRGIIPSLVHFSPNTILLIASQPGLSVADITNSILTDKMKAHSISTLAQGWGGIGVEVFLSLPCIMGANGSTRLAGVLLGPEEDSKLKTSVNSLSTLMSQIRI